MKIKSMFIVIGVLLVALALALFAVVGSLTKSSAELRELERQRYLMFSKSVELERSSEDLTKFARLYSSTGNQQFKKTYYNVLAIRNGAARRPLNYNSIYWNLAKAIQHIRHPLGEQKALQDELQGMPFLPFELDKLSLAEKESNTLVMLEEEAFRLMGEYHKGNLFSQKQAVQLLTSKEYFEAKQKIMLPIDEFLESLLIRTEQSFVVGSTKAEQLHSYLIVLLLMTLGVIAFTALFIKKRLLVRVDALTMVMKRFQSGEAVLNEEDDFDDELGEMRTQFFNMKNLIDKDMEEIEHIAQTDFLTKIKNRRYFYEVTETLVKISQRNSQKLSVMMIDIDHFKPINDQYGHLIGDDVLLHLVCVVQNALRKSDIFARYGGEEFIVALPQTELAGALELAEKIRKNIEQSHFESDKLSIPITVSIGVAAYQGEQVLRQLVQRADEALYEAKEGGRNCVKASA